MDERKRDDSKDINELTNRLLRNIEEGLNSINVDIGDVNSYKKSTINKEELEELYQEATQNLKIDTALIEEVYKDNQKKEHEKYEEEIKNEKSNTEEKIDIEVFNKDNNKKDNISDTEESDIEEETENVDTEESDIEEETENVDTEESDIEEETENVDTEESGIEEESENIDTEESDKDDDSPYEVTRVKYEFRQSGISKLYDKVKGKIDAHYEARRKRKTHNAAMSKVLVAVTGVFLALIIYISYYILIESKTRLNNPYNDRSILMEENVLRGTIYSSDEKILAETIKENGEWKRYYPYGALFSHVVGRYDKGKTGIELGNDYDLLATDDTQIDKIINDINDEKSEGNSIVTTLDYGLQKIADTALGNRNGAVVAIEPSTGKILAMVSKPNYDPNYIADSWEKYSNADNNSENALLNRATQGLYAPGSTFKVVSALEYIRQNDFDKYSYECKGICTFDGHNTRCYNTKVHGTQGLKMSFANSCNTSFANIGNILDIDGFNKTCKQLLFNKDLPYDYTYKGSSFDLVRGSKTTLKVDTAIGQGKTQITPLHNALIASAVANNGILMKPYIVDKHVTSDMSVVELTQPKKISTLMTSTESRLIGEMMKEVVLSGTAKGLKNKNYIAAGKTGSAEYDETNNSHAWFIGYAPYDNPEIAVSIIVEKAGTGGTHAVPIAKKMFDQYLK